MWTHPSPWSRKSKPTRGKKKYFQKIIKSSTFFRKMEPSTGHKTTLELVLVEQQGLCFDFLFFFFSFLVNPFILSMQALGTKNNWSQNWSNFCHPHFSPGVMQLSYLFLHLWPSRVSAQQESQKKPPTVNYVSIWPLTFLKVNESYTCPRTGDKVNKDLPVYKEIRNV